MRGLIWIPVAAGLAVAFAALDRDRGIRTWLQLRADLVAVEGRIASLAEENTRQEERVAALRDDPFAIERAIREELFYAREGETLVRLRPAGLATPQDH